MPRRAAPPRIPRRVPFEFILDELGDTPIEQRAFFGCTALYRGDEILFILRQAEKHPADNGVWVATAREHHAGLRRELPSLRFVGVIGGESSDWLLVPDDSPTFETEVRRACELVRSGDPRVGKVPQSRRKPPHPA